MFRRSRPLSTLPQSAPAFPGKCHVYVDFDVVTHPRGDYFVSILGGAGLAHAAARGIGHSDRVSGTLRAARVGETYMSRPLSRLPFGDSEIYSHLPLDGTEYELAVLISPRIRDRIDKRRSQLIRYQNLRRSSRVGSSKGCVDEEGHILWPGRRQPGARVPNASDTGTSNRRRRSSRFHWE